MGNASEAESTIAISPYELSQRRERRRWIPKVNATVRKAARRDPRYEEKHDIRDWVICRVCGAKPERLLRSHLRLHGLTAARYKKHFPGAPMSSLEYRYRQRRGQHSVPGHPNEGSMRRWPVASLLVDGHTPTETKKELNRSIVRIQRIANGMGLGFCRYDLGVRMTDARVLELRQAVVGATNDAGFFAKTFGTPVTSAYKVTEPARARFRTPPARAASVIAGRDRFISEIAALARAPGNRGRFNSSRFLRSMVPDFLSICRTLRKLSMRTRRFLQEKPTASIADWQDLLCDEAWREVKVERSPGPFAALLPLAAELSQFVEREFAALRLPGALSNLSKVENRILAARFGVTPAVIDDARRADRLAPLVVKNWILEVEAARPDAPAASSDEPKKRRNRGRQEGRSKLTDRRLLHIAALLKLKLPLRSNSELVYPDAHSSAETNTYSLRSKQRKEIDRLVEALTPSQAKALLLEPVKL